MSNAIKRSILRAVHLLVTIPILGYIYSPPSKVEQYAGATRFIFVPVIIFTGYWMFSGMVFAVIGAGLWLGTFHFFGFGAALLSQIALLIAHKIYMMVRKQKRARA